MTKNHLKRIAAPKAWAVKRKEGAFLIRPNPGAHSLRSGLPITVVLRDLLGIAKSVK